VIVHESSPGLFRDLESHRLKRGHLCSVVDVYDPDALEVEFVTAGMTQARLTLHTADVRVSAAINGREGSECGFGLPGHVGIALAQVVFKDFDYAVTGHIQVFARVATVR
jgi:hypothetical protein